MKKDYRYTSIYLILIILGLAIASCTSDEPVPSPAISVSVSPESGNTTQTFTFDLSKSESKNGRSAKVFARWDWEGDGIWDTPFTKILSYTHRYYVPGTWRPKVEMTNMAGVSDTAGLTIQVERGYSAPHALVKVPQSTGHIFTAFLLDGSGTRDDEDSVNLLKYRWDFDGDGNWDTPFGDSARIHRVYPVTGFYQPRMQVRDPSGLISTGSADILVTLEDPLLVPAFRCLPDSVTDITEIRMDASASVDGNNPANPLRYRWDWENDGIWDTGWLSSSITTHVFQREEIVFVGLQVMSLRGLQNRVTNRIRVYHENRPPTANFTMSTFSGNTKTEFRFDGWWARDIESSPSEMLFRWDWDGDGQWDTDYLKTPAMIRRFDTPGIYNTAMEVTDPLGLRDTCYKVISVSHGTNETGMIMDNRGLGYDYYGTVLIGNLWWFQRSLTLQDQSILYRKYNEQYYFGYDLGPFRDYGLYYQYDKLPIVCPSGWRVPSKEDWENLFSHYPEDQLYDALMPGGISDFSAALSGQGEGAPLNFNGLNQTGYYWSTSLTLDPSGTSIWVVSFDKTRREVLRGFDAKERMVYGVRCVKER
jgi:uncharacterized protein (TIGR02145 family)